MIQLLLLFAIVGLLQGAASFVPEGSAQAPAYGAALALGFGLGFGLGLGLRLGLATDVAPLVRTGIVAS